MAIEKPNPIVGEISRVFIDGVFQNADYHDGPEGRYLDILMRLPTGELAAVRFNQPDLNAIKIIRNA